MIGEVSSEVVRGHLHRCLQFLRPFLPMANSHMVTFITDKLYEKYVPLSIRNEIGSATQIDQAMEIYWNQLNTKVDAAETNEFRCLQKHLDDVRSHTLDGIDGVWIEPNELQAIIGCKTKDAVVIKGYMTEKKNYEVSD